MTYTVIFSPHALEELDAAYQWLVEETPQHAPEWHNAMVEATLSLEQHPGRCPLAPDFRNHSEEIRQLLHGNRQHAYRILFTIRGDSVYILHVRHAARKWMHDN